MKRNNYNFIVVAPNSVCSDSPCRHGGTCVPVGRSGFTCECAGGWRGRVCEIVYTPTCDPGPCLNNGTCRLDPRAPRGYRCLCPDDGSVYGENCEVRTPCRLVSLIRLSLAFVNSPRRESGLGGVVSLLPLSPLHLCRRSREAPAANFSVSQLCQ